jgi:hypothetical protein
LDEGWVSLPWNLPRAVGLLPPFLLRWGVFGGFHGFFQMPLFEAERARLDLTGTGT